MIRCVCILFLLPRLRVVRGMLEHEEKGYGNGEEAKDGADDEADMVKGETMLPERQFVDYTC